MSAAEQSTDQLTDRLTDQLTGLVAEILGVPETELSEDSGPGAHPAWTSLKHVEVVVVLEEHFGVAFSSREIKGHTSIAALRGLLASKGVAGSAP
ncbi:phosphopantetheine-binding protein [Kitasatospora purpeofusca]|uniref:phosphopantetheine-binding protein n=1 Tax=Kitasatospora purpeofusca TaxID=67352 RepID=UPI00225444AD|nr:phosphopantetheine-binding protein [Kitasatospora purpeofusca]MCX4688665.1 phosphopantetheine-binding protein [Kitasatospora purpeofusca]